jgi:hypothetical protein
VDSSSASDTKCVGLAYISKIALSLNESDLNLVMVSLGDSISLMMLFTSCQLIEASGNWGWSK